MFKGAFHRMLELVPEDIHERCPVIVGCQRDVQIVLNFYGEQASADGEQASANL